MKRKFCFKIIPVIIFLVVFSIANAQKKSYSIHYVKTGETFASIAARYKINPRKLADYNNLDYYEGQLLSKSLRIPAKAKAEIRKDAGNKAAEKPGEATTAQPQSTDTTTNVAAGDNENTQPEKTAPPATTETSTGKTTEDTGAGVVNVSSSKQPSKVNASKEGKSSHRVKEMLPLIIFLTASILLLVAGILFYKAATRRH